MASAQEYADWIVKNQDKRGTPEFETVAAAYKLARAQSNPVAQMPSMDPTEGMSWGEKFRAGAGKEMVNAARGIGQLVGAVDQADVTESKRLDEPLSKTGAAKLGGVLGSAAIMAPTAFIPGANTITGAGVIGATTGALTTPGNAAERATNAAFGGLGGMAGQALPRVLSTMKAAAEPFTEAGRNAIIGRLLNRTAGDEAASVAARMKTAQPLLPGSNPTAAEVAESGGIAALQRMAKSADPEAYTQRGLEQVAARRGALANIAGDDAKMAAAVASRAALTSPLYMAADKGVAPIDQQFKGLMGLPQFKSAVDRAGELAKERGLSDIFFRDAKGNPVGLIGEGAHLIKKALDEAGEFGSKSYSGKLSASAAADTNQAFQNWLVSHIPEYGAARDAFSAASVPINQMEIGKSLYNSVAPALSDHGALTRETANTYARALRNADQLAKSSTGMGKPMDQIMTAQQMDTINAIAKDLARKANADDLGRTAGSNTFQNLAMDNLAQQMGVPSAIKSVMGAIPGVSPTATILMKGAGAAGNAAYRKADEQMRRELAQALLNPTAAASLMQQAARPGLAERAIASLPGMNNPWIGQNIRPEDLARLLQAAPGVTGAAMGAQYVN